MALEDAASDTTKSDDGEEEEEEGVEHRRQSPPRRHRERSEPLFSCRIDCAKVVHALLTCISDRSKKDQLVQVEVNDEGLIFIVTGRAKFTQTQGTISSNHFQQYHCVPEGGRFTINLATLLDCLQIFGPSSLAQTSLTMSYEPARATFKTTLEEQGVLTSCEISALEDGEDAMDLAALATAFRSSEEVFRAILKSELLKEAISDFSDLPGAMSILVRVSPHAPHFQLSAMGNLGSFEITFPKTSEAFVFFDCKRDREWSYMLGAMNQGMRALSVAKETYLRINGEGIMCVQHQVESQVGQNTFVDFLMCADEEPELTQASSNQGGAGERERVY